MIYQNISELVGKTPLLRLVNYEKQEHLSANIIAKLEYFNPTGSAKDRIAKYMIMDAEEKGLLVKGSTIVEPTSGNTGIGLAALGISKGYKVILVMPDSMSKERIALLKAYGADVVLTKGSLGMKGSIDKALELSTQIPNCFIPSQFDNPTNPKAHYETTGPEIYDDMAKEIDIFVASIGTGGTLTGSAKYLKEQNPNIKIIGVEPASSPLLTKGYTGSHSIQGIGANFVPSILDLSLIDEIIAVEDDAAFEEAKKVNSLDGILVGISSGAVLKAANVLASRKENKGKNIVVLLPDSGNRYLSSELFL